MKKKGKCKVCFGVVASGGDAHRGAGKPWSECNRKGPFWEKRRRKKAKKSQGEDQTQRGVAVAHVGGGKAKTHRTKAKKGGASEAKA